MSCQKEREIDQYPCPICALTESPLGFFASFLLDLDSFVWPTPGDTLTTSRSSLQVHYQVLPSRSLALSCPLALSYCKYLGRVSATASTAWVYPTGPFRDPCCKAVFLRVFHRRRWSCPTTSLQALYAGQKAAARLLGIVSSTAARNRRRVAVPWSIRHRNNFF